jgi:predicted nucleotidyltransferase
MAQLPENIRGPLERFVRRLSAKETVSAVGLFGSWSRGDATSSSDLDLLIIDKRNFNCEYVDRFNLKGVIVDLNYIPRRWLTKQFPLEMDQKLYETYVLYDRDWSLTNTKDWLVRVYRKPHRIDLRTECYVVESDILLSKAFSAYLRGDFQSACVFAGLAVESVLRILIEINFAPISNSRFIELLWESTDKLGMPHIFTSFLTVARLSEVNHDEVERKLELFERVWNDFSSCIRKHTSVIDSLHFRVKTKLKYDGKPDFLQGIVVRTRDIIDGERYIEASHYLLSSLYSMVENYVTFISVLKETKFSYATFLSVLRSLEESAQMCERVVEAFGLSDVDRGEAEELLRLARELIRDVRRRRKALIDWFVG